MQLSGPSNAAGTVVDNRDGTYTAHYSVQQAGVYRLIVTLDGETVGRGPLSIRAEATRTSVGRCFAYALPVQPLVAGTASRFTIQAVDEFGNTRSAGGDPFRATLTLVSLASNRWHPYRRRLPITVTARTMCPSAVPASDPTRWRYRAAAL